MSSYLHYKSHACDHQQRQHQGDVVVVVVADELVNVGEYCTVADEDRGVIDCLIMTAGIGLDFLLSCSLISSSENFSSFSALLSSETFLPRNSTDSALRWDSISSAAAAAAAAALADFLVTALLAARNPFACRISGMLENYGNAIVKLYSTPTLLEEKGHLHTNVIACPVWSECQGDRLIHLEIYCPTNVIQ